MKSHRAVDSLEQMLERTGEVESDLDMRGNSDGNGLQVEIVFDSRAEAQYLGNLLRPCTRRMDHLFRLRCPGARGDSSATVLRHTTIRNFAFSPCGQCLRAAIGNGLYALAGEAAALTMMEINPMPAVSVAQASAWLEQQLGSFLLENVSILHGIHEEECLVSQNDGIFVSRLRGLDSSGEEIDHVVVLDAKRQLVRDLTERFAVKMDSGTLNARAGDGFDLFGILELRSITKHPFGKRKRHGGSRKLSTEI